MIIDFRFRPVYGETFKYLMNDTIAKAYTYITGFDTPQSFINYSMEQCMQEMDEAGITKGVVTGRRVCTTMNVRPGEENANNDAVAALMKEYPGRFIGAFGIDINEGKQAMDYMDKYILEGPFSALLVEPGMSSIPMSLDDKRVLPFYDYCESNNIPILLAFGELNYRAIRHMTIEALDNILEMFPNMKTTIFHGGWPYTNEVCWVAFNRDNLYISPDYTMLPTFGGHQDFIAYANSFFQDKFIFGSAYPFCAMKPIKDYYISVLKPEVRDKVMYYNALHALNMPIPEDAPEIIPHYVGAPIPREISDLPYWQQYEKGSYRNW